MIPHNILTDFSLAFFQVPSGFFSDLCHPWAPFRQETPTKTVRKGPDHPEKERSIVLIIIQLYSITTLRVCCNIFVVIIQLVYQRRRDFIEEV